MLRVLVLTLRSVLIITGLMVPMNDACFSLVFCAGVIGLTLQAIMMRLIMSDIFAFAYGWTEVAYRFTHGGM